MRYCRSSRLTHPESVGAHALGPIFRKVWWHSVAGAGVIGAIAMIQAYIYY